MLPRPMLLPLALLAVACATNRLDRQGDRHGHWRTSYDVVSHPRQSVGRYRHSQPVGRWRYYAQAGYLERQEQFYRDGTSCIIYYHPNGHVWRRGLTKLVDNGRALHYYWTGDWLIYRSDGTLQQVDTYELGKVVRSHPAAPPAAR